MKRLNTMTVRLNWMLVLGAFSLLVILVGAMGLYANHYSRQAFGTLNRLNVEQTTALNRAYIDMLRARTEMDRAAELIRVPSFDAPGPVIERAESLLESADTAYARFLAVPAQAAQQQAIDTLTQRFRSLLNTGLALQLMVLKDKDFSGYRSGQSRVSDMSQQFMEAADRFFATSQHSGSRLVSTFVSASIWMDRAIAGAVVLALILAGLALWNVTHKIIRPLRRIGEHFARMQQGDLSGTIALDGHDEIRQLCSGLATLQQSLIHTVARIHRSSRAIHDGAHDIAHGNQDLASRTEQQAASLVETAGSLDELTSTVAQNADSVRQAGHLAASASQTALQGGEMVSRMVATMHEIDQGSRQVAQIIGMIDEIAFQTNILALNASVEAARAGEQGRGFAVVAGEVRALAGRSASAADQARTLIETSNTRVSSGTSLATDTGHAMQAIVDEIQRVSAFMKDIATATQEQSQGIAQVNQTLAQLDDVTQQNARLVQDAALASQALEDVATSLSDSVLHFRLAPTDSHAVDDEPLSSLRLTSAQPRIEAGEPAAPAFA